MATQIEGGKTEKCDCKHDPLILMPGNGSLHRKKSWYRTYEEKVERRMECLFFLTILIILPIVGVLDASVNRLIFLPWVGTFCYFALMCIVFFTNSEEDGSSTNTRHGGVQ